MSEETKSNASGEEIAPTARTTVKRLPKRQVTKRSTIYDILDAAVVCDVALVRDGAPIIIPQQFVRHGDYLYLHGKNNSALMKYIAAGKPTCITVTHLDGFVVARSAFHHSANYRSVVVMGAGERVDDPELKMKSMEWLVDGLIPGRWHGSRKPTKAELTATMVVRVPLTEASCKVRTGQPSDDAADMAGPYWAGVIPVATVSFPPVRADDLNAQVATPRHISDFSRLPPVSALVARHGGVIGGLSGDVARKLEALVGGGDSGSGSASSGALVFLLAAGLAVALAVAVTSALGSGTAEL